MLIKPSIAYTQYVLQTEQSYTVLYVGFKVFFVSMLCVCLFVWKRRYES